MSAVLISIEFDYNDLCYLASGTIDASKWTNWLKRHGTFNSGLFVANSSRYHITKATFVENEIPISWKIDNRNDTDEDNEDEDEDEDEDDVDVDVDDMNDEDDDDDIKSYVRDIYSNIKIENIDARHFGCNGRKICGCGCDDLHDGWGDDFCNPYPKECIKIIRM